MALSKITNLSITDDTILNADIKSSAAIALSKLATDPSNASNLASGTVPTARLGSGTASSSTVLYGDQTYKAEPGGGMVLLGYSSDYDGAAANITLDEVFSSTYDIYRIVGFMAPSGNAKLNMVLRTGGSSGVDVTSDYSWVVYGASISASTGAGDLVDGSYSASLWQMCSADVIADNDSNAISFDMTINDPDTGILSRTYCTGTNTFAGSSKTHLETFGWGRSSSVDATGVKFTFDGGVNVRDHSIGIYGFKKT